jgi:predicted dehydrogenase
MSYRIGLIGAGFLAQAALLPALTAVSDVFTLTAALDPSASALGSVRVGFPGALTTDDADDFFASGLDAVHIATPNASHAPLALRALAAGLAVLVDKPLADTVEAGASIVDAARASGGVAVVGYMSKYNAYNRAAAALVSSGAIGEPRSMIGAFLGHHEGDNWRMRRAESGLGCLGDLAIYPVITAIDLFGCFPEECEATSYPADDPQLTELHAEATVRFPGNRHLHLEVSFLTEPVDIESRYTVIGSAGTLVVRSAWNMNGGGRVLLCDTAGRSVISVRDVDPYVEQYRQFAACMDGAPVPEQVSAERGLRDLAILIALQRSAAAGRPLTLTSATTSP